LAFKYPIEKINLLTYASRRMLEYLVNIKKESLINARFGIEPEIDSVYIDKLLEPFLEVNPMEDKEIEIESDV